MESERYSLSKVVHDITLNYMEMKKIGPEKGLDVAMRIFPLVHKYSKKLAFQQRVCFHEAYTDCTTTRESIAERLTPFRLKKKKAPATENMVRDTLHKARVNIKSWVTAELEEVGIDL